MSGLLPRLIFIHPSDELYGADRMLLEIVEAARDDFRVEVWLPLDLIHAGNPLCDELFRRQVAVRHIELPILRRANQNPKGLAELAVRAVHLFKLLREDRPDVVYCTTSAAFLGAPVARLARVPRIIGHLQEIWSRSDRRLLRFPARACHSLIAISDAVVKALPARARDRATVVLNGTPEPDEVVQLSTHSGRLRFLVASRWNGWKGHRTLLRAWELAGVPGELVILGGMPMSGESVDVRELVSNLTCPDSVTIPGEVSDPSSYIESADVIIMPSDDPEPFGLIAIEAFARARPVVASAAGGLLEIVTPGVDGWLYPAQDASALAALLRSLSRPSVEIAGRDARLSYEQKFTVQSFVARWRDAVVER